MTRNLFRSHAAWWSLHLCLMGALLALTPFALATASDDEHRHHAMEHAAEAEADDPHAHHRQMMERKDYSRSEHDYKLPDLPLVAMDGGKTSLLAEVDRDQPVMLNFIFTTCTTICPILSASFTSVQQELGERVDQVRMLSVSIDPEHDTPERLSDYAKLFGAGPQWRFLTGELDDIIAVQKAFDVYRGNKMNHEPITLLRGSKDAPWVRINGLASAANIVQEYERLPVD